MSTVLYEEPGPRTKRINAFIGVIATLAGIALGGTLVVGLGDHLAPEKFAPFASRETWLYYVLPGLRATLVAAAVAIVTSISLGIVLALGRLSHNRSLRLISGLTVEICRAIPVLMFMVGTYFALLMSGTLNGGLISLVAVVTGLTLYNGAIIAEVFVSGVNSLPAGQREAGLALGLQPLAVLRLILIPQAIAAMLPALLSQVVVILKDTALGYIVTYPELLRSLQNLASFHGNLVASFAVGGALFVAINIALTRIATRLRHRMR